MTCKATHCLRGHRALFPENALQEAGIFQRLEMEGEVERCKVHGFRANLASKDGREAEAVVGRDKACDYQVRSAMQATFCGLGRPTLLAAQEFTFCRHS